MLGFRDTDKPQGGVVTPVPREHTIYGRGTNRRTQGCGYNDRSLKEGRAVNSARRGGGEWAWKGSSGKGEKGKDPQPPHIPPQDPGESWSGCGRFPTPAWGALSDTCLALREDTRPPPRQHPLRSAGGAHTPPSGTCSLGRMSASLFCARCRPLRGLENLLFTFSSDVPPGDFSSGAIGHSQHRAPRPSIFYPVCCSKRSSRASASYLEDCELSGGSN